MGHAQIKNSELRRIIEEHKEADALSDLARAVLDQRFRERAEGGSLFIGKHFVLAAAEKRGLSFKDGWVGSQNILSLLAGEPSSLSTAEDQTKPSETTAAGTIIAGARSSEPDTTGHVHKTANLDPNALLTVFAARGFATWISAAEDELRASRLQHFLRCADWLAIVSPYNLYGPVTWFLEAGDTGELWVQVTQGIRNEKMLGATSWARNFVRARAIAESGILNDLKPPSVLAPNDTLEGEQSSGDLRTFIDSIEDVSLRAALRILASTPKPLVGQNIELRGHRGHRPLRAWQRWLLWISGIRILILCTDLLGVMVGLRRNARISISGNVLQMLVALVALSRVNHLSKILLALKIKASLIW